MNAKDTIVNTRNIILLLNTYLVVCDNYICISFDYFKIKVYIFCNEARDKNIEDDIEGTKIKGRVKKENNNHIN